MDKSDALRFIEKTIEKTKSNELQWKITDRDFNFKPAAPNHSVLPENMYDHMVIGPFCYVADYKAGYLVFMTFSVLEHLNPPRDCNFALRMQDDVTEYSVEIEHSGSDIEINSQLIRLFNLIDFFVPQPPLKSYPFGSPLEAASLIQDFLNS